MDKIVLTIPTNVPHVSQIITGFLMLREQGLEVEIVDDTGNRKNPLGGLPVATACLRGGDKLL